VLLILPWFCEEISFENHITSRGFRIFIFHSEFIRNTGKIIVRDSYKLHEKVKRFLIHVILLQYHSSAEKTSNLITHVII